MSAQDCRNCGREGSALCVDQRGQEDVSQAIDGELVEVGIGEVELESAFERSDASFEFAPVQRREGRCPARTLAEGACALRLTCRGCPYLHQVMSGAPQGPFGVNLLLASKQKLAESPAPFHLSKHRFGELLP